MGSRTIDYAFRRRSAWAVWWCSTLLAVALVALHQYTVSSNPDSNLAWLPGYLGLHFLSALATPLMFLTTRYAHGDHDLVWVLLPFLVAAMLVIPLVLVFLVPPPRFLPPGALILFGTAVWAAVSLWRSRHVGVVGRDADRGTSSRVSMSN